MKKACTIKAIPSSNGEKYPSAQFLYSVSLEDYNRILSNYDKIYDRVNIALAFCGIILIVILNNIDISVLYEWCSYTNIEKTAVALYFALAIGSAVLIIIAVIKLLLLSRSKTLFAFDSNSIKQEELYSEKVEDSALWVTLQYIRVINELRKIIGEKQKSLNASTVLVVIALVAYVVSMLIYKGGLS